MTQKEAVTFDGLISICKQHDVTYTTECTLDELNALKGISDKIVKTSVVETTGKAIKNGISVRTTGKGIDAAERRINTLQEVAKKLKGTFWQVEYDIPIKKDATTGNTIGGIIPNPSKWFWKIAIRLTKSCWIMPEEKFLSSSMTEWMKEAKEAGCKIRTIKYAADQIDTIHQIAVEELSDEIRRLHTALINNIGSADEQLKLAIEGDKTHNEQQAAQNIRDGKIRKEIRDAGEALDNAIVCAELFDSKEEVCDLLNGLREAVRARGIAFNAHAKTRNIKPAPLPE